ncbi:phosphopantetheine-binding protein [Maribacter sp. TH_r10]|uniref:acyl carrier protein n=1 Tax=Maribacter sp. TH_r10 TaxID=3082086 RepID=UPI002955C0C8|nr:phosphopantetheine-binding protein [Maribacter sp. TH_r10]MDV7140122.1 phosphopantetheine-binding protein [Maribacter sp. TH_r10]
MEEYLATMSEILDVESVELSDHLTSFETWDSLTNLALIAHFSSEYNISLSAEEIENAETIQGLKELIDSRR